MPGYVTSFYDSVLPSLSTTSTTPQEQGSFSSAYEQYNAQLQQSAPAPTQVPTGFMTGDQYTNTSNTGNMNQGHQNTALPSTISSLIGRLLYSGAHDQYTYWQQLGQSQAPATEQKPSYYLGDVSKLKPVTYAGYGQSYGLPPGGYYTPEGKYYYRGTSGAQYFVRPGAYGYIAKDQPGAYTGPVYEGTAKEAYTNLIQGGGTGAPATGSPGGATGTGTGGGTLPGGGATGGAPGNLNTATKEALAMANAYFAPKRIEMAYELEQLETDMRRLSVNLGRQIDDPVLQAKLRRDALKAVRLLDADEQTFALQMVEQRRKEMIQMSQFQQTLQLERNKLELELAVTRRKYGSLFGKQFNPSGTWVRDENGYMHWGG